VFTGLIRDVGTICSWEKRTHSVRMQIETKLALQELQLGASVACNGVCLTVIESESFEQNLNRFTVEAGPKTLELSRFGIPDLLGIGALINLEPALKMGDSLGGHLLSGHVDTRGCVIFNKPTADGFWHLRVGFDSSFGQYVVKKGSIALSGVSLTIVDCYRDAGESWVDIMLIPHTLTQTNLQALTAGCPIEIEFDGQAKLVADMLEVMLPSLLKPLLNKN
jgi:riboflavin synthase